MLAQFLDNSQGLSYVISILSGAYYGVYDGCFWPVITILLLHENDDEVLTFASSFITIIGNIMFLIFPLVFGQINQKDGKENYDDTTFWLIMMAAIGVFINMTVFIIDYSGDKVLNGNYKIKFPKKTKIELLVKS